MLVKRWVGVGVWAGFRVGVYLFLNNAVLGLAWGDFQNKYFFVYTSLKHLSLNVSDDTNLFHLVSDSQCLSFLQELTPTLTLGLNLGLELGLPWGDFQT